jgi:tRNA pseudouridine38-40 synthase
MNEAAALLVGEHNFTAFGTPPRPGGSTRRKIYQAGWSLEPYGMHFDILANAFLYHMVRRVVYIQVQIGLGRVPLDDFRLGLADLKAQMPGLAPAHGLSLEEVLY